MALAQQRPAEEKGLGRDSMQQQPRQSASACSAPASLPGKQWCVGSSSLVVEAAGPRLVRRASAGADGPQERESRWPGKPGFSGRMLTG